MSGFDEQVDFVVVGSGGGSMCAALVMRAAGKRVLIVEKAELVGGTTARSGGVMWIPNNPFMQRDGVPDSFEQASAYLEGLISDRADTPGTSAQRRNKYLVEAPRMVEFLLAQGLRLSRVAQWPDYYDERPGGSVPGRTVVAERFNVNELGPWKDRLRKGFLPMPASLEEMLELPAIKRSWRVKWLALRIGLRIIGAKLTGKQWVSAGAALQGRMLQSALRAGVEIRTASPVRQLIVEEGLVKGVVTVKEGRPWRIAADLGVLVNAGGFARNQQMRDRYQPGTSVRWTMASSGDTGEMIGEMMLHGAAVAQMEEMVGTQLTLPPGTEDADFKPTAQRMTAAPHAILVDQSGVRYMNEGGSYMAFCRGMFERNQRVPAVPSWAVFDGQYMRKYMLGGKMPGARKPQQWYDAGYLHEAGSIEALAGQLRMESSTLKATVERFNGFVAANRDTDFQRGERAYDRWLGDPLNRPSQTLGAISESPYYAVPVVPGDVGTFGGVVTDEHARVLREDGSVIGGLYATGVSTASVMGRCYPGAGCSIGPSFVWGWVAAKHALVAN
ncbi:MAG: FAD-dependent oxidoreductase [Pseudomonadota bacterium]|nr:FAD-dependent oxidoreductase [Pseudomonadota bacterium]